MNLNFSAIPADAIHPEMDRVGRAEALAQIGNWEWDRVGNASTWSQGLFKIYGRNPAFGVPAFDGWRETIHPDDEEALAHEIAKSQIGVNDYSVEFRIYAKDTGELKYIASRGSSTVDEHGRVIRIWGVDQDITQRKKAELALQSSLRDKEALLREVHHRVKNNLQVITSLLRLEKGRSEHAATHEVLEAMQSRIRAMALLHETIYRRETFAAINLGDYLAKVATQSFRFQQNTSGKVELRLSMGVVSVGLDQAAPCGLLLNELISNALKHGFSDGRDGEVAVDLAASTSDDRWTLRVSDTGAGLPANFLERRKASLGLELVNGLAKQMGGRLEVGSGPVFSIVFKAVLPGNEAGTHA